MYYVTLAFEEFIKAVVGLVVNLFPSLISYFPMATEASARTELGKLTQRANRIRARLDDADKRQIESKSVLHWLSELRAIAFDAEDLEDEFETKARLTTNPSYWTMLKRWWYCKRVLSRVDEINKKYDVIYQDRKAQKLQGCPQICAVSTTQSPDARETGSWQGTCRLHGRHQESEMLIRLLRDRSSSGRFPPVLSIIGAGGMGKTALAQSAFNHPDITNLFEPMIWVSLSPNPGPIKIIKKIIEAITKTNCNLSTLDMLQHHLRQLLSGKTFLLVLDDVYTEDMLGWDTVWTPLNTAHTGSKILVTTRNRSSAQKMGSTNPIDLNSLNSAALWLVLKDEAFPQAPTSDSVPQNLRIIGQEIAAKCYGFPLAAKLLGKTLHGVTNEVEWHRLLQEMPDPDAVVDNILPSLKLSYEMLPLHLKRCFAYCSIFPKGYEFDRDNLVKLWMSEGFLEPERPREGKIPPEDIGRKKFTDLLWRSFFEPSGHNRYVMPGAIHDLAQSVSFYECARMDQSGVQHGKDTMTRYASLCGDHLKHESLNHVYDTKHLRTLIVCTMGLVPVEHVLQQKLSSNLRFLRSLDLSNCKFDKLDKSIGNLIHLRYLNVCGSLFKTLPDSICKLINLQTLNLDECYNLKELPRGMSSLTNMRHIGLSLNWEKWDGKYFDFMPPDLRRLKYLQTLSRFVVARRDGCGITELKDLDLQGELCISKLENVKNGNEAIEARLYGKKHLEFLMLRWSSRKRFNSVNEEEVLRKLCPSNAIKSLWIEGYNGSEFPSWVTDQSFRHLETLKLLNCKICANLPPAAELPHLKSLYLNGLDKVEDLNQMASQNSVEFQSLELLHLSDMPELEKWFTVPNVSLRKLSELSISNCPKLKEISYLPSSICKFELRNCTAQMVLPSAVPSLTNLIVEGVDSNIIEWIQNLTSLTSLSLIKLPELKCITCENLTCLRILTMLKIEGCKELESIAETGDLEHLPPLKKLDISYCKKLQNLFSQGLPRQIEELQLKDLAFLNSLPSELYHLHGLHTLEIRNVPNLRSSPMMPESLCFLSIKGCPVLQRNCDVGGLDWPNVRHARCLIIGDTQL